MILLAFTGEKKLDFFWLIENAYLVVILGVSCKKHLTNCSRGIPNAWRFGVKFGKSVYGVNV